MSSPGIRPRNNPQTLRVLSADAATRAATPSIAMPRAKTELTELLAGDQLLCVRRRASAAENGGNPAAGQDRSAGDVRQPIEPPRTQVDDVELGRVIDAWTNLPRHVRAAILAMARDSAAGEA